MIWHIAKKDFLDNFTSARFVIGFLICLFLVPYTVYTGTKVYRNRVEQYQRDVKDADEQFTKAQVYGQVEPIAVIPPNPLAIFCKGISEQVGSRASLSKYEVATFATGITTMYENKFLNRFMSLDFVNIMAIMLSLIGIFLSYDIFSREKESGTLKLLLSNRVKRSDFFLGKIAGIFLTFLPLLLISYLLVFIILWISPQVALTADDYARIILLFVFSLLYLAFFIFLGSYISSRVKTSSTSLIINLFIWCFLLFLLPNAMAYLGKNIVKTENYNLVSLNMGDLSGEYWQKNGDIWKQLEKETGKTSHSCNICTGDMWVFTPLDEVDFIRRYNERNVPVELDYADKKWHLQEAYLKGLYRQQRMIKYLSSFSPSEIFKNISSSLCRTDMDSHVHFMDQARQYRDIFYNYYKINGLFSKFSYFDPQKESEIPRTWDEAQKQIAKWKASSSPKSTFDLSGLGYINTTDLPRFTAKNKSILDNLSDQLWLTTGIIVVCIILVWVTYRSFIQYDIR